MNCPDCNGTGKIATNPYREAPPLKQEKKPTSPPWYKRIDWFFPIIGLVLVALILGIYFFARIGIHDDSMMEEREHRKGYVLAQYDDKGEPVRCWVVAGDEVKLSDHKGFVQCDDRSDSVCMQHAAFALGIKDVNACVWMDKTGVKESK